MVQVKRRIGKTSEKLKLIPYFAICGVLGFILGNKSNPSPSWSSPSWSSTSSSIVVDTDESCKNVPTIRPSGAYFLDTKYSTCPSLEDISPSFNIATKLGPNVKYHMGMDVVNFQLMKELLGTGTSSSSGGSTLSLDIGANQGFYTYYLAALGMEVHSFEIFEDNFKALQHGADFNPPEMSDRIHLYPVGLGEKNGRFGMQGVNYEGFLKEKKDGPILGLSMDCFVNRASEERDWSNLAFVKLDVEGFEIAVLKGAHNSLLSERTHIGGMVMEVGPSRWGRAGVEFPTGIEEMKRLASKFKTSYVLIRTSGSYWETCPPSLVETTLKDKSPRVIGNVSIYKVAMAEWEPLLAGLDKIKGDCNFFYENK